jgi:hypothetical protein
MGRKRIAETQAEHTPEAAPEEASSKAEAVRILLGEGIQDADAAIPTIKQRFGLTVIVPITSRAKEFPLHVRLDPPEGGLHKISYIKCEDVRSVSVERLSKPLGRVSPAVLR